jgi:hypothetical protein
MMPRRVALLRELRSVTDALYLPNQFLIVIDSDPPYISREMGKLVPESLQLHVFAHEYWHYLHNLSTVAGFQSFAITQHHVAAFGAAKAFSAAKEGQEAPNTEDGRARMNVEYALYGDPEPQDWSGIGIAEPIAVTGLDEQHDTAQYRASLVPLHHVVVQLEGRTKDGATHPGSMLLGAIALYESVAAYIENHVLASKGQGADDSLPSIPYRVAPLIAQHIVGEHHPYYAAALATLALLDTRPGKAFLDLTRRFRDERRSGRSEVEALDVVVAESQERRNAVCDLVLTQDLPELERINAGRGLSDYAVRYYGSIFRALLELRRRDPLFDLHILLGNPDGLFILFKNVDPCNVLQRYRGGDDDVGRDEIFGFDNTPQTRTESRQASRRAHFTRNSTTCARICSSLARFSTPRPPRIDAHISKRVGSKLELLRPRSAALRLGTHTPGNKTDAGTRSVSRRRTPSLRSVHALKRSERHHAIICLLSWRKQWAGSVS